MTPFKSPPAAAACDALPPPLVVNDSRSGPTVGVSAPTFEMTYCGLYPMAAAGSIARAVAAGMVAMATTCAPDAFKAATWLDRGPASVEASYVWRDTTDAAGISMFNPLMKS